MIKAHGALEMTDKYQVHDLLPHWIVCILLLSIPILLENPLAMALPRPSFELDKRLEAIH